MNHRTRSFPLALAVVAWLALAGCGSDAGTVGAPTDTATVTSERTIETDIGETTVATPTDVTTGPSDEPATTDPPTTEPSTTEPATAETGFGQSDADRERMLATSWVAQRFITVGPLDEVSAGSTAGFRFLDDHTISVDTGCNTGTGTVTFGPGGTFTVGALGLTKVACADDTESKLLSLFDLELVWSVDGDQLTIYPLAVTDVGLILVDADTVVAEPTPTAEQTAATDRADVIAAAVLQRVTGENSFGGQDTFAEIAVVEIFGESDGNAILTVNAGGPTFTDAERAAVEAAVDPISVRWTDDQLDPSVIAAEAAGQITAIVTVSEPGVDGDSATITTGLFCGSVCGTGGTYELARQADGSWIVTGSIGPQWIS